jgi:AbrB family looped-hinge helix DNA binding protein
MTKTSSVTWTSVDPQGRVVIPASLRRQLEIAPGDEIAFVLEDGILRLMTVDQGVKRAQAIAARYIKKERRRSIVDEFLAERRAEATRDQ